MSPFKGRKREVELALPKRRVPSRLFAALPQEGEKKDNISIYSEHRDGIKPEVTTYLYGRS